MKNTKPEQEIKRISFAAGWPEGKYEELIARLGKVRDDAMLKANAEVLANNPHLVITSAEFEIVGFDDEAQYEFVVLFTENEQHFQARLAAWQAENKKLVDLAKLERKINIEKARQSKIKELEKQLAQLKGRK